MQRRLCSGATMEGSASATATSTNVQDHEGKHGSSNNLHHHDIAIIGGGMVGMALACSLASKPLTKKMSVAIVDSNPSLGISGSINKDDHPDPRVSTVTPATISFFKDIGAWEYVQQHRHAYFEKMQVWDYTGLGFTRYNARDVDKDILGCVVENKVLHSSLLSCVQNSDFQKTIYPARLMSMTSSPSFSSVDVTKTTYGHGHLAKLELSDGNSLCAKLVVGADGGKSHVRQLAGFKTIGWSYSQNAVICTVEHSVDNRCAWQRFLPSGPIALLPMGDSYSNIVWTMSPEEASELKSMQADDFIKALNHALDYGHGPHPQSSLLGSEGLFSWFGAESASSANERFEVPPKVVKLVGERMAFPLSLMHASSYASNRVVLIGDAAHTVHPLAGQGVNLGFSDALSLSKVIADGVALGIDIGELSMLKKYERERKPENVMMMGLLDGFQKAYSVDFGPLNVLRAAAFHGANYISPLKRKIISYASGEPRLTFFA